jgi:hypothetical protein
MAATAKTAKSLLEALESKDADAVAMAFTRMYDECAGEYDEDEEPEETDLGELGV